MPYPPRHKAGGQEHDQVVGHTGQGQNAGQGTEGAASQKYREGKTVKQAFHRQAEDQQDHRIEGKEQADGDSQMAGLRIADQKRLGGTVGDGKEHDDGSDGQDFGVGNLERRAAAFRAGGEDGGLRFPLVPHELDDQQRGQGEGQGDGKGGVIAECLVDGHPDPGGHSHSERVHHAVYAHTGAHFLTGKHIGHPGGHTHGTAGKTHAVDDSKEDDAGGMGGEDIAQAGQGHQRRADGGHPVFAEPVRQIAHQGAAKK